MGLRMSSNVQKNKPDLEFTGGDRIKKRLQDHLEPFSDMEEVQKTWTIQPLGTTALASKS